MANNRLRILPNGMIEYPRKGTEPPPDSIGFVRDPKNPWRFIPQWQRCTYRLQVPHMKPCGNMTVKSYCRHTDSPTGQGGEIQLHQCEGCPLRK